MFQEENPTILKIKNMVQKYKAGEIPAAKSAKKSYTGVHDKKQKAYKPNNGEHTKRSGFNIVKKGEGSYEAFSKGKLRIIMLGGLEEVGRNMALIQYEKEIIIIDMGLQFPEEDMPGIDYIIPNIAYLEDKQDWIKGVIITHGHMDHIGGIPHIIGKIGNPPMFMGKLTAGLVRKRCEEFRQCPVLNISEIDDSKKIKLGAAFRLEFLRVNHSIPDSFAVIIHTSVGVIMHTGDFKID
jgi:ribonuclease J